MRLVAAVMAVVASAAAGQGYRPDLDLRALKFADAARANQVLVLGTPHLAQMPPSTRTARLTPLIERLATWRPQMIAVEGLSGTQCAFLRQYPGRYRDTVTSYCWDPAPARAATGLDVPAATEAAETMLAAWPAAPTAAQRRRLAALFLAGGEQPSALVQWLHLPAAERRAGDGLDATLVARLAVLEARRDETYQIAVPLAVRLGLQRIHAMDDHSADAVVADEKAYGDAIGRVWDNPGNARRKAMIEPLEAGFGAPGGVMALYRAYNAPGLERLVYDSDFGAALGDPSPQQFGRAYVGYWETRNLRMAANIRDMIATRPGSRSLVVVGASHKPYLESYLDMMHDVQVVDAMKVLR